MTENDILFSYLQTLAADNSGKTYINQPDKYKNDAEDIPKEYWKQTGERFGETLRGEHRIGFLVVYHRDVVFCP